MAFLNYFSKSPLNSSPFPPNPSIRFSKPSHCPIWNRLIRPIYIFIDHLGQISLHLTYYILELTIQKFKSWKCRRRKNLNSYFCIFIGQYKQDTFFSRWVVKLSGKYMLSSKYVWNSFSIYKFVQNIILFVKKNKLYIFISSSA